MGIIDQFAVYFAGGDCFFQLAGSVGVDGIAQLVELVDDICGEFLFAELECAILKFMCGGGCSCMGCGWHKRR